MSRHVASSWMVVALTLLLTGTADAQEAKAGGVAPPAPVARPPDFKVVVWYHAGTWHALAYDVRKGEFHAAVEDWVRTLNGDPYGEAAHILLPRLAYIKEVRLEPRPGTAGVDDRAVAVKEAQDWIAAEQDKLLQDKLRTVSSHDIRRLRLHQLYPSGSLRDDEANTRSRLSGGVNQPAPLSGAPSGVPTYLLGRPR
jgi:hypothetical protein